MLDPNRMKELRRERHRQRDTHYQISEPSFIFHYSCPDSIVGILSSKQLWCTDIRQVNDPDEGDHGVQIMKRVIIRKSVPSDFRDNFLSAGIGLKTHFTSYIACFCSGTEQSHMWKKYACDSTGCAIQFDFQRLLAGAEGGSKYGLCPVIYDHNIQTTLIEKTLDIAIDLQRREIRTRDLGAFWSKVVLDSFLFWTAQFKGPQWESEQETRLWVTERDNLDVFKAGGRSRTAVSFSPDAVVGIVRGRLAQLSKAAIRELLIESGFSADVPITDAAV
jgi:hypothetical protein